MSKEQKGGLQSRFSRIHAKFQAERKVRAIEVPEWPDPDTGEPTVLYAYPLTVSQIVDLETKQAATQAEKNAYQIIAQCMQSDGKPFFSVADKVDLMNQPADLVGRIMIALNGELSSFDTELKKNKKQ